MGLIDQAVDAFENEINNLKLNVKDTVEAMDYEYSGSLYDTVLTTKLGNCLLYTSPSPRDRTRSRMPSSA